MTPPWLAEVRRIQAIAQIGLAYGRDPYDLDRYRELAEIAVHLVSRLGDVPPEAVRKVFDQDNGYATPKVDVRGAVFKSDQILLVRERADGLWTLPGGWADRGETPSEAVTREVREESGFEVRPIKLAAILDRDRQGHTPVVLPVYKLFFLCELTGGAAATSVETSDVRFFSERDLPPLSPGRVLPKQIHRLFEHLRTPSLATDFD